VGKYDPLRYHLALVPADVGELIMSFAEVEALVGALPTSARTHPAWWADDSKAWNAAGWRVKSVDQGVGHVVFKRSSADGSVLPVKQQPTSERLTGPLADPRLPQGPLSELSEVGLTKDELSEIALLEDDPSAPELVASWFDSKRQVALTAAGACAAGAVAAFIGDATIVATAHGIFSGNAEIGAVASLTALVAGCGVATSYYFNKVRKIANKSLRVQHILNKRRPS
jgi:hypothetical protein